MTKEELEQFERYTVQAEESIQIPVRQYADAIMAIQKLNDIKNIANLSWDCEEECETIVCAIRAITG